MRKAGRGWLLLLVAPLVLGAVFGTGVLATALVLGLPWEGLGDRAIGWAPWLGVPAFGVLGALTLRVAATQGVGPAELVLARPSGRSMVGAVGLVLVMSLANRAVFHPLLLRHQPGFDPTAAEVPLALLMITLAVACLAEDLLYRGYAFVVFRERHGVIVATIATSLGYAALTPGPELPLKIWAFGFGIVLALLRHRSGSLWPVIFVHYATSILPRLAMEGFG